MVSSIKRSLRPVDGTLKVSTVPGQSEQGRNSNEGVFHIPWSSKTETSQSEG